MAAGARRSSDDLFAKPAVAVLAIAALCVGLYSNTFGSPFHFDEAARHYTEAIRIAPRFAQAHNHLGMALAGRGRVAEAIRHYRAALEIDPDFAKAHNNLGMALSGQGRFGEAERHYAEALRPIPDYAKAHNNLGVTLARQGRLAEAKLRFAQPLTGRTSRRARA